jgi:thioredoxin-related protein
MMRLLLSRALLPSITLLLLSLPPLHASADDGEPEFDAFTFDDTPLAEPLHYPDWFKESFLDLGDDLDAAVKQGKQGLIVYFGQKRCAYCNMLMEVNFGLRDIREYTQRHFDVVPIDIWGVAEVTDLRGDTLTERKFALRERTNFTPSLVFYDAERREALRLRGYYPPYQFRAALEYVAGGHYKKESFPEYLARGEDASKFEPGDLNEAAFFALPPHNLDRSRFPGQRPLVVFFEQGECHACDVLHGGPLRDPRLLKGFGALDTVQLDIWSDTPVITPAGKRTTGRDWAKELGLFYAPSLMFFDENGKEILMVDSVVGFYRLNNVLEYIGSRAYKTESSYQAWRVKHYGSL